jgi:hypothetical protein
MGSATEAVAVSRFIDRERSGEVALSEIGAFLRVSFAVGLVVCVSACGGGGGGGSPNPVLGKLSFTTNENVALASSLTATDPGGGQVTFSQTGNPASGAVSGFTPAGAFTYTPNPNFIGNDSFAIQAADAAGNKTAGTVMVTVTANQPPTATSTVVRSDDGQNINVLKTANDPDMDHLTVTITTPSNVGTAVVNSDGTVSISGLNGFKGLARFGYTVTDPSAAKASANAAIFVGVAPFRALFVADPAAKGSYEVYLTDFAAATPTQVSTATQGNLRLKGFAASDNGATVVYRTQDTTSASMTSLSLVRTATPSTQVPIPLPSGIAPLLDGQSRDQFVVSPDGNWIALIAGAGNSNSLYVVNAGVSPPTVTSVVPTIAGQAAIYATKPTFTSDSKSVYFLATSVAGGTNKSLYLVATSSPAAPTLVSKLSVPATNDEVSAYSVALNQSTIVELANRAGRIGLFYVDPAHLQVESPVNTTPDPGTAITSSTVGLAPGLGGSYTGNKVAYDVGTPGLSPQSVGIYVADVPPATPPNPQFVAQLEQVIGFSPPDDKKLLYTDSSRVFEIGSGAGNTGTQVGVGNQAWYDSGGNIVLLQNQLSSGYSLTYNTRPFGSPKAITPAGTVAYDLDVSGFGSGVVIFGQAANTGSAPATTSLQLVSALSPGGPLPLMSPSATPLDLTSDASRVVTY